MSAFTPVPPAPASTGWGDVERFVLDVRLDVEWGAAPTFETLGRLTMLRVAALTDLRDQLDELIAAASAARREAHHA